MQQLSTFWQRIQRSLIPALQEELGPLSENHKKLIAVLEIVRIEEFIQQPITGLRGRPEDDRRAIARSFIAKTIYSFSKTNLLIDHLSNDPALRRICGWERRSAIPSESTCLSLLGASCLHECMQP